METPAKKTVRQSTPAVVKDYRAALAAALLDRGVPLKTFLEANNSTDFPVSQSTLYAHVAAVHERRPPLSAEKGSGRPSKLTDEQWSIVFGAVLMAEEKTDLTWAVRFVLAAFDVNLDESTISRHLAKNGLTFRLTCRRTRPANVSEDQYAKQYFEFVKTLRDDGFFKHDPKRIICVDFVTNSRRLERERTIAMLGSKQKKLSRDKPKYTNSYLVAVTMDDDFDLPALMFTYDPTFDPDGPRTADVRKWCIKWGIDRGRIFYEKRDKKYCKEAVDHVAQFKRIYREKLMGARVLHDDGNSFKINKEHILAEFADEVRIFPPAPHGELSVLDNNIFAIAKNWWIAERPKGDFSKQDLYLLWCIDWASKEHIRKCWDRNFMLHVEKLSLAACAEQLKGTKVHQERRLRKEAEFVESYVSWRLDIGGAIKTAEWTALDNYLDGPYWTK